MKRYNQTIDEIVANLSRIKTTWADEFSGDVLRLLEGVPLDSRYNRTLFHQLLSTDFKAGMCLVQIILGYSKDELTSLLREAYPDGGAGRTRFVKDPDSLMKTLESLGLNDAFDDLVARPVTWKDLLIERLRGGRGSAIKGQVRGKVVEDFVETLVREVFGEGSYHIRCRFTGSSGQSTEKADFAIPSREDSNILIEAKAYGATGSKQTDVLGDIERILREKRSDTTFLLVVDGETWKARMNDLRKIVERQNEGRITRIYTMKMREALKKDLRTLKREYGI